MTRAFMAYLNLVMKVNERSEFGSRQSQGFFHNKFQTGFGAHSESEPTNTGDVCISDKADGAQS
jgi:hypothetical protein